MHVISFLLAVQTMDIVDRCAHELIQQALTIHRTASDFNQVPPYNLPDMAKLAEVMLGLKLQEPLCDDHRIQRSQKIILRVRDLLRVMPLRPEVHAMVLSILEQLIRNVFRHIGLDW